MWLIFSYIYCQGHFYDYKIKQAVIIFENAFQSRGLRECRNRSKHYTFSTMLNYYFQLNDTEAKVFSVHSIHTSLVYSEVINSYVFFNGTFPTIFSFLYNTAGIWSWWNFSLETSPPSLQVYCRRAEGTLIENAWYSTCTRSPLNRPSGEFRICTYFEYYSPTL